MREIEYRSPYRGRGIRRGIGSIDSAHRSRILDDPTEIQVRSKNRSSSRCGIASNWLGGRRSGSCSSTALSEMSATLSVSDKSTFMPDLEVVIGGTGWLPRDHLSGDGFYERSKSLMYRPLAIGRSASWLKRLLLGRSHCVGVSGGDNQVLWTFTGDAIFRLMYCCYLEVAIDEVSVEAFDDVESILAW